jgi:ATP phosphoribosyltransferase regulatory subunit
VTARRKNILRLPQGTETFHLGEALRHRERLRKLEDLYGSWGYLPVETPVFDFYDIYAPLMRSKAVGDVYRLIDREGELLLLRSDATLFLAKQLGLILQDEDLPVRVYYADTILRHQDPDDISKNEFVQTGVELIGVPDSSAEAEVILLLWDTLAEAGATDAVIHIGSRKLINEIAAGMEVEEIESLRRAVQLRDASAIAPILDANYEDRKLRRALETLFAFLGSVEELRELRAELATQLPGEADAELGRLEELATELTTVIPAERLRIDLSEVGVQPYYTGVVFRAYIPGTDAEIASGGRYDELLGTFGFDAPSVGFSLIPGKVDSARATIAADGKSPTGPKELPDAGKADGRTLRERYENARKRRQSGERVRL